MSLPATPIEALLPAVAQIGEDVLFAQLEREGRARLATRRRAAFEDVAQEGE
jgi:hypothetical protein